ncbi:hypothetical protein TGAM01_v208005 [Trichoderma gamsii]|uniref:Uncharacterized protein n=1 Tax=Trichoderma gamsii TaxID=398673 RepID=A0A2P4ZG31_9HYPO|nr:hypothetical protein TGAM01_v208005 [Trichoderma gamsii]PON23232.1 hypothetical protein TGAM01_v208005 [Trichoderma gamsii]
MEAIQEQVVVSSPQAGQRGYGSKKRRDVPKQKHEALGGLRTSCRVIGQGPGACQKPLLQSGSGLPRHSIRQNVRRPNQVTTCGPSETRVVDEQPSYALLTGPLSLDLTRVEPLELERTNEEYLVRGRGRVPSLLHNKLPVESIASLLVRYKQNGTCDFCIAATESSVHTVATANYAAQKDELRSPSGSRDGPLAGSL